MYVHTGLHGDVTQLLERWHGGDREALDELAPIVHGELRQIADGYLRRERNGHTLQPTALVNEAWLRLVRQEQPHFESRKRFFALAAQVMRHILVDYARAARTDKRGAATRVTLQEPMAAVEVELDRMLALDQALNQLAFASPRQARIIEMRYFGGLNGEEIAELLGVSAATISREQMAAEAWLSRAISPARDEK
jgi:RNA polymerase sigma factor (TIGR02999 family)